MRRKNNVPGSETIRVQNRPGQVHDLRIDIERGLETSARPAVVSLFQNREKAVVGFGDAPRRE